MGHDVGALEAAFDHAQTESARYRRALERVERFLEVDSEWPAEALLTAIEDAHGLIFNVLHTPAAMKCGGEWIDVVESSVTRRLRNEMCDENDEDPSRAGLRERGAP